MNLASLLENTAARIPGHTALRFEGRLYTFEDLNVLVNRTANGLKKLGLGPGDRCVLRYQWDSVYGPHGAKDAHKGRGPFQCLYEGIKGFLPSICPAPFIGGICAHGLGDLGSS